MSVIKAFNNHFQEFVEDILRVFPENKQIKKAKLALEMLNIANPKLILVFWRDNIYQKYKSQIDNADIEFFVTKDYKDDVVGEENNRILNAIDNFRQPVKDMSPENKEKVIKYIQNLSQLSMMYNN